MKRTEGGGHQWEQVGDRSKWLTVDDMKQLMTALSFFSGYEGTLPDSQHFLIIPGQRPGLKGLAQAVSQAQGPEIREIAGIVAQAVSTLSQLAPESLASSLGELPEEDTALYLVRTAVNLARCKKGLRQLEQMLAEQSAHPHSESEYQGLIKEHPWLLGSHLAEFVKEEQPVWFDSRTDLMLKSSTGTIEVVELKRPDTTLLKQSRDRSNVWYASSDLSEAFGQALKYLRHIDEERQALAESLRLDYNGLYRCKVYIVAGLTPSDQDARKFLRDIAISHQRIELRTFSDLVETGRRVIRLLEQELRSEKSKETAR